MATFLSSDDASTCFPRALHIQYFLHNSRMLPGDYTEADSNRLSLLYFNLVALDILNAIHVLDDRYISFIYNLQLEPKNEKEIKAGHFGFVGSTSTGISFDDSVSKEDNKSRNGVVEYQQGHLAMIYTALMCLITLGDDLTRVNKGNISKGLTLLQQPNGSFSSTFLGGESDIRFVFCAMAISFVLDLWCENTINLDSAVSYILSCQTYEGGFGLRPGTEAQGGATYCAVAALKLSNKLTALSLERKQLLIGWCERREQEGFEGRTNKVPDSCYSFWIGGTLNMLGCFHIDETNPSPVRSFLLNRCQQSSKYGGFSKYPDLPYPDILHSFYSICWLAMNGDLKPIEPMLGICRDKVPSTNHVASTV